MSQQAGALWRRIRLLLIDDHAIVRQGVRALLEREPDLDVVGEAASLAEALEIDAEPDVVVADLRLGDAVGATVVERLHQRFPAAAILVLSMVDRPDDVRSTLAAGASGYLLKDAAAAELVEAVHRLALGEDYMQPSLGLALARPATAIGPALSERERDILRLVALGHTNAEIGRLLHLSLRTIEAQRMSLSAKVGARSRAELVRYALRAGLVVFDEG